MTFSSIPFTHGPVKSADEHTFLSDLQTWLNGTVGWDVWNDTQSVSIASGFPTWWFRSEGEDGLRHIVGGFGLREANKSLVGLVGGDIDNAGGITDTIFNPPLGIRETPANVLAGSSNGKVGGYTNRDNVPTAVLPVGTPTLSSTPYDNWVERGTESIRWIAVATKDYFTVLVEYLSATLGNNTQGILHIGIPGSSRRPIYTSARSRIKSISNGGGTLRVIELEHNITNALKASMLASAPRYPEDEYPQLLLYQAVVAGEGAGDHRDFGMTERLEIEKGTLTTNVSGLTEYTIDLAKGVKLGGTNVTYPGRYESYRGSSDTNGKGDIVSLLTQPTIALCESKHDGNFYATTEEQAIASWNLIGGQEGRAGTSTPSYSINARLISAGSTQTDTITVADAVNANNPAPIPNRYVPYKVSIVIPNQSANQRPNAITDSQIDNKDSGEVGSLQGFIHAPGSSTPNLSIAKLNGLYKYRKLEYIDSQGISAISNEIADPPPSTTIEMLIGPGW